MKAIRHIKISKEKIMATGLLLAAFLFLFCVFSDSASAGLSVNGGLTREIELKPGENYEGTLRLLNSKEKDVQVKIFLTDYSFSYDGKTVYGEPGEVARSNASWIDFSPSRVTIPAEGSAQIYYEIDVPKNSNTKGTYWSVLMVEPIPRGAGPKVEVEEGKMGLGVRAVVRYAVQIITEIGDGGEGNINIVGSRLVKQNGRTLLQMDVENSGERYLSPSLWVELYNTDGRQAGRVNSGPKRIFPDCSVRHSLDLTDMPAGEYTALLIVDNGDENVFGTKFEVRLDQ